MVERQFRRLALHSQVAASPRTIRRYRDVSRCIATSQFSEQSADWVTVRTNARMNKNMSRRSQIRPIFTVCRSRVSYDTKVDVCVSIPRRMDKLRGKPITLAQLAIKNRVHLSTRGLVS